METWVMRTCRIKKFCMGIVYKKVGLVWDFLAALAETIFNAIALVINDINLLCNLFNESKSQEF